MKVPVYKFEIKVQFANECIEKIIAVEAENKKEANKLAEKEQVATFEEMLDRIFKGYEL